jgi:signal peptidase II
MNRISRNAAIIVFLILAVDQTLKYIKTHFYEGQDYHVMGDWFILHFVENRGMAFSLEIPSSYGKFNLVRSSDWEL